MFFTRQDDAFAPSVPCQANEVVQELRSNSKTAEFRHYSQSENTEIATMRIVVCGVVKKLVTDRLAIRGTAIDMTNRESRPFGDQEAVGKRSDSGRK